MGFVWIRVVYLTFEKCTPAFPLQNLWKMTKWNCVHASVYCLRLDRSNYAESAGNSLSSTSICCCCCVPEMASACSHQIHQIFAVLFSLSFARSTRALVSLQATTFHFHTGNTLSVCHSELVTSNVNIFMVMFCIWMMIDMRLKIYLANRIDMATRKETNDNY